MTSWIALIVPKMARRFTEYPILLAGTWVAHTENKARVIIMVEIQYFQGFELKDHTAWNKVMLVRINNATVC
jgi:hypothetical protein